VLQGSAAVSAVVGCLVSDTEVVLLELARGGFLTL
jgi:hypothetical protein